jgi:hypothetical protein
VDNVISILQRQGLLSADAVDRAKSLITEAKPL